MKDKMMPKILVDLLFLEDAFDMHNIDFRKLSIKYAKRAQKVAAGEEDDHLFYQDDLERFSKQCLRIAQMLDALYNTSLRKLNPELPSGPSSKDGWQKRN
jgi:hypothetical protein